MLNFIERNKSDLSVLLLRVFVSLLMLGHGFPKLMTLLAGKASFFPNPIGIGATASLVLALFSEFFCSLFVLVGFKTRLAAIPLAITMFVAAFIFHCEDPWKVKELSVIYLCTYIVLIIADSGKFSLDEKLK